MSEVLDLEAYRARPRELLVTRIEGWTVLRAPLRAPVFLTPEQAIELADLLQKARTLETFGPESAHGVEVAASGRHVTVSTTATGALTLTRRAAVSLTLALARSARSAEAAR